MFEGLSRPRRRPNRHATLQVRAVRHALRIPCQVVRESDFRLVADRIADLSMTGMLVNPADPVLTGERMILTFKAPDADKWLDAEATVTRIEHGRRPGETSRALGLVFDHVYDRRLLERLIALVPPAPLRHRPGRRDVRGTLRALINRSGLPAMPAHPFMQSASRFAV